MAGKISDYTVAGPLLGSELLDVSQVDGMSMTGYSTRSVTLDDVKAYVSSPTFYDSDGSLAGNRIVDQDGNYLIFEGGGSTYWQVDGVNDGLYYDYGLRRGGIGTEFPDVRWHVKAKAGEGGLLVEDFSGVDMLWQDSNGKVYIRTTSGSENIELRSTGGNPTRIKNNSNELAIMSVGLGMLEGGNGAGGAIIVDGYLAAGQVRTPQSRTVQIIPNTNKYDEIQYALFQSISGTQTATFGYADAEEQRYDVVTWYSELTDFKGEVNVRDMLTIRGEDFVEYNSGSGAFLIGNAVRVNDFYGTVHRFNGPVWCYDVRSTIAPNTNYQMNQFGILFRADGSAGSDQVHFNMNVATGASTPNSVVWKTGIGATDFMTIYGDQRIKLGAIPTYADDAAAGVGGLTTGHVYKTATGELRIKL
jgi:hypothetical protein